MGSSFGKSSCSQGDAADTEVAVTGEITAVLWFMTQSCDPISHGVPISTKCGYL